MHDSSGVDLSIALGEAFLVVGHQAGEGIYDLFDFVIGEMVRQFDGDIDRTPLAPERLRDQDRSRLARALNPRPARGRIAR